MISSITYLSITLFLLFLLYQFFYLSCANSENLDEGEYKLITWSDPHPHTVRLYAPCTSDEILNQAKQLVERIRPFEHRPQGGTFLVILQREFYLNKYLWFFETHKRFPTVEKLVDKPPTSYSFPYKHKPIPAGEWN